MNFNEMLLLFYSLESEIEMKMEPARMFGKSFRLFFLAIFRRLKVSFLLLLFLAGWRVHDDSLPR